MEVTFRKLVCVAMVAASGLALTGCNATSGGDCGSSAGCGIGGAIGLPMAQTQVQASAPIDATGVVLDTSGSTIAYPSSGTVTVSLYNSSGSVMASRSFPWVLRGTGLVFANPNVVNQWESANNNGITQIKYQLAPFTAGYAAGTNTMAIATNYQGVTLTRFSTTFTSVKGSPCPSCRQQ